MAIYHFPTRNISRSSGRSAVAAAAYRAGLVLEDERTGQKHDYSRKVGVVHSEIIAPEQAPAWMKDRQQLWNAAEKIETRKDARTAREFIAALPDELDTFERQTLLRRFVIEQFVSKGMVADVNTHLPDREGDQRNHHAHILLTTRRATEDGFSAKKERDWNSKEQLVEWREAWADHVNLALERGEQVRGLEPGTWERVDHRSLEEQGIDREPTIHLGPQAMAMEREGIATRLGDHNREVVERTEELQTLRQERAQIDAEIVDLQAERERRAASAEALEAAQRAQAAQEAQQRQEAAQRAQEAHAAREREAFRQRMEDDVVKVLRTRLDKHARERERLAEEQRGGAAIEQQRGARAEQQQAQFHAKLVQESQPPQGLLDRLLDKAMPSRVREREKAERELKARLRAEAQAERERREQRQREREEQDRLQQELLLRHQEKEFRELAEQQAALAASKIEEFAKVQARIIAERGRAKTIDRSRGHDRSDDHGRERTRERPGPEMDFGR